MQTPLEIRLAAADQTGGLIETLVLAFENDPVNRWIAPELDKYLGCAPGMTPQWGSETVSCQRII